MFLERRIREQRKQQGLTQKKLGELLGVSKVSVCHWEKGLKRPSSKNLIQLSKVLNVPLEYLIGNDEYIISSEDEKYGLMMSKEEIKLIEELRKYPKLYDMLINSPKRVLDSISKNY